MLAPLALPICLAFIFIALRQDMRECREVSHALWIPLVWLAEIASRPLILWVNPNLPSYRSTDLVQSDYLQGSPLERVFLIVLLCVGVIVLLKRRDRFALRFADNRYLFFYYAYILLSCGWSDYQGASVRKWIRGAVNIVMVLIVLTEDRHEEAIEHILRRCAFVLMPLSVVLIKYYSYIGTGYSLDGSRMWTGVTTQKNSLGILCAIIGTFFVWRLLKRWPKLELYDVVLFILTLYLLRGASSITSDVVFIMGTIIVIMGRLYRANVKKLRNAFVITLIFAVIFQASFIAFFNDSLVSQFFSISGRNASFTGRIPLWRDILKIGNRSPIFGSGYGTFWIRNLEQIWSRYRFHPTNGHNGYIDVYLDYGLAGLLLLLMLIIHAYKNILGKFSSDIGINLLLLAFLTMILVHNISESTLAIQTNLLWFLLVLSSVVVTKRIPPSIAET